jgi:hypothetical protein
MTQHLHGKHDSAMSSYREALSIEANHADELIKLAMRLERLGRSNEAIRLYEDGINHAPCLEFYVNLAALRISAKQADLAIAPLEKATEIAPGCTTAHLNLGVAFYALGNNAGALASFGRAFELNPDDPRTLGILGTFLDNLGGTPVKSRWMSQVATTGDRTRVASERLRYDGTLVERIADLTETSGQNSHPNTLPEREGTDIGDPKSEVGGERETKKLAFVSPRCVLDFASGAATATRDGLKLLAGLGLQCEAYCGSKLDGGNRTPIETVLRQHGEPFAARDAKIGPFQGRMIFSGIAYGEGRVPVTIVDTTPTRGGWLNREEIAAFLTGWEMFLDATRPGLIWTYGGDPVSLVVQQMARQRASRCSLRCIISPIETAPPLPQSIELSCRANSHDATIAKRWASTVKSCRTS